MTITSSKKKLLPPPDPTEFIDFEDLTFSSQNSAADREAEWSGSSRRRNPSSLIQPALGMAMLLLFMQASPGDGVPSAAFMNLEPVQRSHLFEQKRISSLRSPKRIPVAMENALPASDLKVEWNTPDAAGGFGAVYFGELVDGEEIVVKVSYKDEFSERLLSNELHFNEKLQSAIPSYHGRRWASFLGACRIPNVEDSAIGISSKRGLVFKREAGKSLDHFINSHHAFEMALALPPSKNPNPILRVDLFTKLLGELLCCMAQVHRAGLIHRDVKPDNILLVPADRDCPVKLIDFGSACDLGAAVRRGLGDDTVDPLYAPPELRVDLACPHALDVFCAATTALRVLMPSLAADPQRLKAFQEEMQDKADFNFHAWCEQAAAKGASKQAAEARALLHPRHAWILALLTPMLDAQPGRRPTPQQVLRKMGPLWAARLDSLEILAPVEAPLVGSLGQRLARELRSNPAAIVSILLTSCSQAGQHMLKFLSKRLPRISSAISEGTKKILRSVTQGLFA